MRRCLSAFALVLACCGGAVAAEPAGSPQRLPAIDPVDSPASRIAGVRIVRVEEPSLGSVRSVEETFAEPAAACCPPVCSVVDNCFRGCGPVYGFAEALFYDRNNTADDRVVVVDEGEMPVEPLRSVGDLDTDLAPGFRATVGWHLGPCHCCNAWEASYLGIYGWDDRIVVEGDNDLGVAGFALVNNFTGADRVTLDYSSDLNSGELNCVHCLPLCCGRVEFLLGFRYVALDERFDVRGTDFQQGTSLYRIDTNNDLFGGQLGVRLRKWSFYGFEAEMTAKAGLYGNQSQQLQTVSGDFPDVQFIPPSENDGTNVAFLGELNLTLIYPLTDRWAVRGGYNLLWLQGVALAPEQFGSILGDPPGDIRTDGGLFAHGASIGLEARW